MKIRSFAKINLGLEVLGRRPDGYHELRTLFQSVSLADELTFTSEPSGRILLQGNDPSIPWDERNLIFRAALLLQERTSPPAGARIGVKKVIPSGKGLGGGSSNAAMTLLALNRLWGLGLGAEELAEAGRRLGADVPFFFSGGLCLGLERGDRITPLEDLPALPLVIALPPFSCPTADIYRHFKLTSVPEDSKIMRFFGSRQLGFLENSLEPTVFRFHPRLQDLKALFRSRGAELSLVTGSGSAVFGLFRDGRLAAEAKRAVEKEYPAVVAETVPRRRYEGDIWAGV